VRFTTEHRFPGPPGAIAAVLADPDFYRELELPDLRLLEVRAIPEADAAGAPRAGGPPGRSTRDHRLALRYEFTGSLDALALRLLGGERLTWSQEVHLFGDSGGWLMFAAESNPRVLHGRAEFTLEPEEAVRVGRSERYAARLSTLRRLHGELTVALPIVGGMAERRIVAGLLTRLDLEADAACHRLARSQSDGGAMRRSR
jgi:hypothetical protein